MKITLNNKIICKPYQGTKDLKAEVKNGFATVLQKNNLVGLELLIDAVVLVGTEKLPLDKGTIMYFEESRIFSNPVFRSPIEVDGINEPCVLVNFSDVVLVDEKDD